MLTIRARKHYTFCQSIQLPAFDQTCTARHRSTSGYRAQEVYVVYEYTTLLACLKLEPGPSGLGNTTKYIVATWPMLTRISCITHPIL